MTTENNRYQRSVLVLTRSGRRARCAEFGHEGATYNPWTDMTWCLCGHVIYPGNVATHTACCYTAPDRRNGAA